MIANGEISTLANRSKDYAYSVITLALGYDVDTDAVIAAVQAAGGELARDTAVAPYVLEPLEVLGIDDFATTHVTLRFRIKTLPLRQGEVGRELRRQIKKTLDARGVKLLTLPVLTPTVR